MFDPAPQVVQEAPVAAPALESAEVRTLRAARALITDKTHWGQGSAMGREHRFCALDALARVEGRENPYDCTSPALAQAARELLLMDATACEYVSSESYQNVYTVNDHLGHAATLAMFDRAVEIAQAAL